MKIMRELMAGLAGGLVAAVMLAGTGAPRAAEAVADGQRPAAPGPGPTAKANRQAYAGPLAYTCPAGGWPCPQPNGVTGQVLATYDPFGNPLLEVSPYTYVISEGLPFAVTPLRSIRYRVALGWESPVTLARTLGRPFTTSCTPPQWQIAANDSGSQLLVWHCVNRRWVKAGSLP